MTCESCGEDKPDVRPQIDPYIAELDDEEVIRELCDECWQSRKDDI